MRKKIIAGNWKMNTNIISATKLTEDILNALKGRELNSEVLLCPPFTNLFPVNEIIKNSNIFLGAQNCDYHTSGAYTGEVSVEMLKSAGSKYIIVGHSERRTIFKESDETVGLKAKAVLEGGLTPIICIGETLDERNSGNTFKVLERQITKAFEGILPERLAKIVIAYEPVWAIGTGVSATNEQAGEAHHWIRNYIHEKYGNAAGEIRILYGGSMNQSNSRDLLLLPDVDGGLIGGASLKAESFLAIIDDSETVSAQ